MEEFFGFGGGDRISVVRRVRKLNQTPVQFLENVLCPETAKHMTIKALSEQPLQAILKEKRGLEIGRSETYLDSVPADPHVAESLHSNVFAPLLSAEVLHLVHLRSPLRDRDDLHEARLLQIQDRHQPERFSESLKEGCLDGRDRSPGAAHWEQEPRHRQDQVPRANRRLTGSFLGGRPTLGSERREVWDRRLRKRSFPVR